MGIKSIVAMLLFAGALAACSKPPLAAEYEDAAKAAAHEWLAYVDAGAYAATWDGAAPVFKASITRDQWIVALDNVYVQLGKPAERELIAARHTTSMPNAPSGDYVIIQYRVSLGSGKGIETLTMEREGGAWKASGYFIRPE